jgi:murein L,D-transpeptidase YcbB/YkuD
VYATAVVEADGQVDFLDDIYGHDATLDALLVRALPGGSLESEQGTRR